MPADVKSKVGSFDGSKESDGTRMCRCRSKNDKYASRISAAVMEVRPFYPVRRAGGSLDWSNMTYGLVWLCTFGWYLHGLTPGMGGEDSGEFVSAFAALGSTHPPGYPLFVLVGRLALLLPVGSPAFRANLLSAALIAGAVTIVFAIVRHAATRASRIPESLAVIPGLIAAAAFAASKACWYQAVISDKYPLHLLLFTATFAAIVHECRWGLILLLAGLGAAHHPQMVYLVPALVWHGVRSRAWRDPSWRAGLFAMLAAVSLKVLEPPIRGYADWPLVFDPAFTARDAWSVLTLRPYAHRIHGPTELPLWIATVRTLVAEITPVGLAAGAAGLAYWVWRVPARGVAALLITLTGLVFVSMLGIFGREYHALPVTLLLCCGIGILAATARGLLVFALVPAWLIFQNLPMSGHHRAFLEHDYGRQLLAGLPPRSILFVSNDDHFFTTLHQQTMLEFRRDVLVVPRGYLTMPFLKARTRRYAPELDPILRQPFRPSEEDRAARAVVAWARSEGRPCFTTSAARTGLFEGLRIESRDAVYEVITGPTHHPATALWYPTRSWRLDPRALTWKHELMIETQGQHQISYAGILSATGRVREAVPRYLNALTNPRLPHQEVVVANTAVALRSVGRTESALRLLQQLVNAGTPSAEVYLNYGISLSSVGDGASAARAFSQARDLAPVGSPVRREAERLLKHLR